MVSYSDLILPAIKDDASEVKLDIIKSDIMAIPGREAIYFPRDFRFNNIIIDSIARKYSSDYPSSDSDDERYIVGLTNCKGARDIACSYLKKVFKIIDGKKEENLDEIIAIYLFDTDDGEENHQKFLILTKKRIYIRYRSNRLERFEYSDIVFKESGIESIFGESIVNYEIDDSFAEFVQEWLMLLDNPVNIIDSSHPFAGKNLEYRYRYAELMVDAAAADGYLTVDNYLRLEYIAREFRISPEAILEYFYNAAHGGIKDNKLSGVYSNFVINGLNEEYRNVFFFDLLGFIARIRKIDARRKAVSILSRKEYLGSECVEKYIEYIKSQHNANEQLRNSLHALKELRNQSLSWYNIYKLGSYSNSIGLKMLNLEGSN